MTKDTDGYLVLKILPSSTYGVNEWPRISTGTIYQVLPIGWTNDQGYRWVPSLKNSYQVLPTGTDG